MTFVKIVLFLLITNSFLLSQRIDPLYEVGTWQGFRTCAISYTFDDGCANQFTKAIPLFDEFGFKLTLFTVINGSAVGTTTNWTALQNAANKGHEIASHTVTHPNLGNLTDAQQLDELKKSREEIEKRIKGTKCITMAYPYCATGNVANCKQVYTAGRICSGQIEPKTPADFHNISSLICGSLYSIKTAQDFNNSANSAAGMKGWATFLLHGIDNDGGYSPVESSELRGALEYLSANPKKFWIASFGDVVRYIKERNIVKVDEVSATDTSFTLQVTDTLDNEVYNVPVTIRRELPVGWLSAQILQNGKILSSEIVESNSKKYVMFDVVPDSGDILINQSSVTAVNKDKTELMTPFLKQNYPNPFNPTTKIKYSVPVGTRRSMFLPIVLKVYDLLGNEMAVLVNEEKPAGDYEVEFDGRNLSSGIYFYTMIADNFSSTKKLILMK